MSASPNLTGLSFYPREISTRSTFGSLAADLSFGALQPSELFLFKLHSPNNFIVGGGLFGHASRRWYALAEIRIKPIAAFV